MHVSTPKEVDRDDQYKPPLKPITPDPPSMVSLAIGVHPEATSYNG